MLGNANRRLSLLPVWKQAQVSQRRLEVDKEHYEGALSFRTHEQKLYLYLKTVFEDERTVEETLRALSKRPDITLRSPVTDAHWRQYLYDASSPMAMHYVSDYEDVLTLQTMTCQGIFRRPLSVLCGAAGTGKTTVVKAIISAIEKAHGAGTSFQLLSLDREGCRPATRAHRQRSTHAPFLPRGTGAGSTRTDL